MNDKCYVNDQRPIRTVIGDFQVLLQKAQSQTVPPRVGGVYDLRVPRHLRTDLDANDPAHHVRLPLRQEGVPDLGGPGDVPALQANPESAGLSQRLAPGRTPVIDVDMFPRAARIQGGSRPDPQLRRKVRVGRQESDSGRVVLYDLQRDLDMGSLAMAGSR